jgi:non-homologous end joining protein Ku
VPGNVVNLMDALRASIKGVQRTPAEKPAKVVKKSKSAKPAARRKAG